MRTATVLKIIWLTAMVTTLAVWLRERNAATALTGRVAALRRHEQDLAELVAERNRLRERLRIATQEPSDIAAEAGEQRLMPLRTPAPEAFGTNAWTSAADWKNEGRSSPRATLATLLWAAAGGDLGAIKSVMEFDDAARRQALAWYETLPPASRSLYATPEDLVASVTIKNIPPTSAQLTWFHQPDNDHAIVGVLLTAIPAAGASSAPLVNRPLGEAPPNLIEGNGNRLAVLTLHRTVGGWRVSVPSAAIDHMAKTLRIPLPDR